MPESRLKVVKALAFFILLFFLIASGVDFYQHRNYLEPVVIGEDVTQVKKLSDYFKPLKDTAADCNIYILDSGISGGTVMAIGGSHPEEPAANLTAELLVENAVVKQGKMVVVIRANRSASTVTRPGEGYPLFYHIPTPWGVKKFRMGDRWSNPLDSWPDPEVYIHHPSNQMLAYMDVRNLNRTWPGRANGLITEQVCYALTRVIEEEEVDLFIDYHEAELEYPVISTIVAHQEATEFACMTSMILSAGEFERPIGMEYSPKTLHGLSHREIGDHTRAVSVLFETPEPFLDRVRGITDEKLLLTGMDPFVMKAGEYGLLYEKIDENGWHIDVRVGRHCSTTLQLVEDWSMFFPAKPIVLEKIPVYDEIIKNGIGYYFHNPEEVSPQRLFYE